MSFEAYRKRIEEAETVEELTTIFFDIMQDRTLTEKEKRQLKSIYLGRKRRAWRDWDIYESEVYEWLSRLNVTEELRDILEDYLLVVRASVAGSIPVLRKHVLPDICRFIDFMSKLKKRPLAIDDLSAPKLKDMHIIRYLKSRTESVASQRGILANINTFGKWLVESGYIDRFPKYSIPKEEVPPKVKLRRLKGYARTAEQIRKLFTFIAMPRPKVTKERARCYKNFLHTLLVSGTRPTHLLLTKVRDFHDLTGETVLDAFDREFIEVYFWDVVDIRKRERGEKIRKKRPAPACLIPVSLYEELLAMVEDFGLGSDDHLFSVWDKELKEWIPLPPRTLERQVEAARPAVGVPNLKAYDMRSTWATIMYNMSGKDLAFVTEYGGWREDVTVLDHYVKVVDASESYKIAMEFEVGIPVQIKKEAHRVVAGLKARVTPEDVEQQRELIRMLQEQIKTMREQMEFMRKEIERLRRGE